MKPSDFIDTGVGSYRFKFEPIKPNYKVGCGVFCLILKQDVHNSRRVYIRGSKLVSRLKKDFSQEDQLLIAQSIHNYTYNELCILEIDPDWLITCRLWFFEFDGYIKELEKNMGAH